MQTQNAHLLVIEDRADNLNELLTWLREDFGYQEIVTATTTSEALEKLASPFDVVISDMRMYDEVDAGFTILDWVQQHNLSSVVIIFTANESLEDCYRAWKSKAWDLSGAENSGESQDETMVIRANSIRKSNFSRLAIEAQAGGGLVLGKICKRGRGFCW